ncbi:hypothetical protein BDZ85DRAFT_4305 [Elsinoe ampelina]|uniref:Uncharacterized protein n=1 Tax=Elsinoe ampelina TaxID=302913 RepID=A0A6A6GPK3_9PEZI|nr:hypothetical protein BDZ85DRAFT_4305 [Elsinoe ampelina]
MTDARALLSASRQSRRVTHPYARYTDNGNVQCTLCEHAIKSEAQWNSHLKTPEHAKRALRAAEASKTQANSRKRKAGSDEEDDTRKRARGDSDDDDDDGRRAQIPRIEVSEEPDAEAQVVQELSQGKADQAQSSTARQVKDFAIEDDPEWLELQKMLDEPVQSDKSSQQQVYANATISAAPMTAEELAAKAREEQSIQRGRREQELEEERDDAQEALQAEFDEMDELEERVRKLREKREALRKGSSTILPEHAGQIKDELMTGVSGNTGGTGQIVGDTQAQNAGKDDEEDEEDDDDDADLDDWNFGAD